MKDSIRIPLLIIAIVAIVGAVYVLESRKVDQGGDTTVVEVDAPRSSDQSIADKAEQYELAKEITTPDSFINSEPFELNDLIGEKVILIDFWTYSCINCQRTTPFLNAWYEKYRDQGLEIVGIHTPEFEFEKEYENVLAAVEQFEIEFPVVQDNDFSTWRAYENRYWPRKYLIDIDGYIVYDHIGEGAYDETEAKIQELLQERAERLGELVQVEDSLVDLEAERSEASSREVYFGSDRNEYLANGEQGRVGEQTFTYPETIEQNKLYLVGTWNIQPEFAQAVSEDAQVVFSYTAKGVYTVASSDQPQVVQVRTQQGSVDYGQHAPNGSARIQDEQLYRLLQHDIVQNDVIILDVPSSVRLFTFTFG